MNESGVCNMRSRMIEGDYIVYKLNFKAKNQIKLNEITVMGSNRKFTCFHCFGIPCPTRYLAQLLTGENFLFYDAKPLFLQGEGPNLLGDF